MLYIIEGTINIISLFAMVLIIGIGLDYGIFMLASLINRNETSAHTPFAITIAGFTTIITFGILVISKNHVLSSIGLVILFGILFTMIFSIGILPAMQGWFKKRSEE